MRLFTIQKRSDFLRALRVGYLTGGTEARFTKEQQWEFRKAFDWMRTKMSKRLSSFSGDYPVWAWVKRPDLRESGHLEGGTLGVLLTAEVPNERVLISDFDLWHCVLNDWYLPQDDSDVLLRMKRLC